jgi:hypothetical protein
MQYDSKVEEMRGVVDSRRGTFNYFFDLVKFPFLTRRVRSIENFQYGHSGAFLHILCDMEMDYEHVLIKWLNSR